MQIAEAALQVAVDAGVEEAVIEDARMELFALRSIGSPSQQNVLETTSPTSATASKPSAKENIARLQRDRALKMLLEAMSKASKESYRNFCSGKFAFKFSCCDVILIWKTPCSQQS
jgi:hypothetical protein